MDWELVAGMYYISSNSITICFQVKSTSIPPPIILLSFWTGTKSNHINDLSTAANSQMKGRQWV